MLEILAVFVCVLLYRAVCHAMNWTPWPIVQVTFHNYAETRDEA